MGKPIRLCYNDKLREKSTIQQERFAITPCFMYLGIYNFGVMAS